jgi:fructokinase
MTHHLSILQPLLIRQKRVAGIGELLWRQDHAGGTPLEFAVMAARLGDHGIIASRVGTDAAGRNVLDELSGLPVDLNYLQTDVEYPTGVARISGEPLRERYPLAAWDHLEYSLAWRELAQSVDAVWYSLMGQRCTRSRQTIHTFLSETAPASLRIFEPRAGEQPIDPAVLHASLAIASAVKLTEAELAAIAITYGLPSPSETADITGAALRCTRGLLAKFPLLRIACVTLGSGGSLLATREQHHTHPGCGVPAGSSPVFAAALAHYALDDAPLAVLNEAGSRWGAWAAAHPGRVPPLEADTLTGIARAIERVRR